jgi:2-haloacid dehalogenase
MIMPATRSIAITASTRGRSLGYPTFWVNRLNAAPEELEVVPDGTGKDLRDLMTFVNA